MMMKRRFLLFAVSAVSLFGIGERKAQSIRRKCFCKRLTRSNSEAASTSRPKCGSRCCSPIPRTRKRWRAWLAIQRNRKARRRPRRSRCTAAGGRGDPAPRRRTRAGASIRSRAKLNEAANLSGSAQSRRCHEAVQGSFWERPPEGDWSIAYYETLGGTPPTERRRRIARLRDLAKQHPDDTRYAFPWRRLLTYNPHTRAEGVKTLESIPATDASATAVRDAWRQALVWEHGNPAYEASLHNYLSRAIQDPDLEKQFGPIQSRQVRLGSGNGRDEQAAYQALQRQQSGAKRKTSSKNCVRFPRRHGGTHRPWLRAHEAAELCRRVEAFRRQPNRAPQRRIRTLDQALDHSAILAADAGRHAESRSGSSGSPR